MDKTLSESLAEIYSMALDRPPAPEMCRHKDCGRPAEMQGMSRLVNDLVPVVSWYWCATHAQSALEPPALCDGVRWLEDPSE